MLLARASVPARRHRRRLLWRPLAAGVAILAVVVGAALSGQVPAAQAAAGQVRGHVFQDFDGDGVFDSGNLATSGVANDKAIAGVTVTAFDKSNALIATAVTTATGNPNYTLNVSSAGANAPLRIEFTVPAGMYDSFNVSTPATGAKTSVRFVQSGTDNVNLGLVRPADFNSNDPWIATVLQRPGFPNVASNVNQPAVVINKWSVANNAVTAQNDDPACPTGTGSPNCADFTARKVVAKIGDVGSVYSVAYDATGRDLFVAASYKRGAGLGTQGLGGIYRINDVVDASGNWTGATPTVTNWVDVAAAAGLNINVGLAQTNATRLLNSNGGAFTDPDGFAKATKIGIGGMVIDHDARILYFVNLNDKKIYGITLGATPTLVGSWATPASSTQRAFALSMRNGELYVGYNDTGEAYPFCPASSPGTSYGSGAGGTCTGNTANALKAYVARMTPVVGSPAVWSAVLTAPLGYNKGNEIFGWQGNGSDVADDNPQVLRWNTWTDQWSGLANTTNPAPATRSVGIETFGDWGSPYRIHIYPQPFVASIAFDTAGFLTLGLGDRSSTQSGNNQLAANNTTNIGNTNSGRANREITYETIASGDTLLAALNSDGTYSLENNRTASGSSGVSRTSTLHESKPNNAEGPGGNEFYNDRQALGTGGTHREASLGAVLTAQGVNQVASTMIDPLGPIRAGGLGWFNSNTGELDRGYQQENDTGDVKRSASFQKGGGIGGLALLLQDAPVEIGNRVWYDADLDGIQDADEPAISGAPVELYAAGAGGTLGSLIGTTTTASDGTWYFRTVGASGGTPNFLKNADYIVVFPSGTATDAVTLTWPTSVVPPGFSGLTWAQMQRTVATAGGAGPTTVNDSNPDPVTGYAPISVGGGNQSDHTIDAGWFGTSTYQLEKAVVGTAPTGATYTINVSAATNFRGDDRLGPSSPDTVPLVNTLSYTLNAPQIITTTERVPYGYTLKFNEAGVSGAAVAFTPAVSGDDDTGQLVISPTAASAGVRVRATNSFGSIEVTKILDSATISLPAGTTFPIEYTIDGGTTQTAEVAVGTPLVIGGLPLGAAVKIQEPFVGPFTWGGYIWATPTWTQGGSTLTPDVDGWITVPALTSATPIELTVTNRAYEPPTLPFAGGIGEYLFTIAGGLVLALGVAMGAWQLWFKRRRRFAAHRA